MSKKKIYDYYDDDEYVIYEEMIIQQLIKAGYLRG
jgi:hypothetical protein